VSQIVLSTLIKLAHLFRVLKKPTFAAQYKKQFLLGKKFNTKNLPVKEASALQKISGRIYHFRRSFLSKYVKQKATQD